MNYKVVDFHLHSFHSRRNGDAIGWNNEMNVLINLRNQNVGAFAITDHDYFNLKLFTNLQTLINNNHFDLNIFPGCEITIKRVNGNKGHILFIFNNDVSYEQLEELESYINLNASCNGINIHYFINGLIQLNIEFMMIPHVGKCDYIQYEDIIGLEKYIMYVESPSNKKELTRFNEQAQRVFKHLMFSDSHNWNNYTAAKVYINEIINFTNLKTKLIYMEEN